MQLVNKKSAIVEVTLESGSENRPQTSQYMVACWDRKE